MTQFKIGLSSEEPSIRGTINKVNERMLGAHVVLDLLRILDETKSAASDCREMVKMVRTQIRRNVWNLFKMRD